MTDVSVHGLSVHGCIDKAISMRAICLFRIEFGSTCMRTRRDYTSMSLYHLFKNVQYDRNRFRDLYSELLWTKFNINLYIFKIKYLSK